MRSLPALQTPAVVFCGSSTGKGAAIVRSLVRAGHPVSFGYRPGTGDAVDLERELIDAGFNGTAFELDPSDSGSLNRFASQCTARFGPPLCLAIDSSTDPGPQGDDNPHWVRVMDANLSAAFRLVRQFVPEMQSRKYGRVVLVGSAAALVGRPEQEAFCAASAALEGLTRSLAVKYAPWEVLVTAVALGYIEDDGDGLTPVVRDKQVLSSTALRRMGKTTEIADAVRFLCGPDSSAMTGCVLRVDGGLSA